VYRMFFLGGNFESSLICTLKSKKPKKPKNLKTFSKKPRFFPALIITVMNRDIHSLLLQHCLFLFSPPVFLKLLQVRSVFAEVNNRLQIVETMQDLLQAAYASCDPRTASSIEGLNVLSHYHSVVKQKFAK